MPVPYLNIDQQAIELLPSGQRRPKWVIMVQALLTPVKHLYNLFRAYLEGETAPEYDGLATYTAGDIVQYLYGTYESLGDGNIGNVPSLNPAKWMVRNENILGAYDRTKINGRKVILEYALNKYFATTFRQPDHHTTPTNSDIYITNQTLSQFSIIGYPTLTPWNTLLDHSERYFCFDTLITGAAATYGFVINLPASVYAGIHSDPDTAEKIMRTFVDRYKIAGTHYIIQTY